MYDSRVEDIKDTIAAIKIDLNDLDTGDLTVSEYDNLISSIELKLVNIEDTLQSLDPSK
jgi:hypothetical protein